MNFKKLLDLFEAPAKAPANLNYKGTVGTQAIQGATNQAKPGAIKNVNVIKPGQQLTLPGGGSYQVKAGDTMDRIARRNPAPTAPTVSTALGPAATVPAPSTDNDALKGQIIGKAMSPAPVAPTTADTRGATAMASNSTTPALASAPVATADSLSPGETIVDTPAPDTRGAAAMASKSSAPAQAAAPEPSDSTSLQSSPDRFSDYPQGNLRPGRQEFGFVSEEDEELNELMRLSGRPVNEKAVSKQQQKFMGMVHAMQKGKKIKGASPELKKVAKTMNNKDAKDFASTKHKGLPTKVSESVMLEAGSALEHIINKFKHETKNFLAGNELDSDLYEALFDYYSDNGEIPYGVAKARDGDPRTWVEDRFENELDMMGHPRTHSELNFSVDHELTELARLAGLTNEDGPGASRLYTRDKSGMGVVPKDTPKDPGMGVVPKDSLKDTGMGVAPKQTSLKDKMSNEGISDVTDTVIDTAKGVANKGIDAFNDYEQRKKDRWDSLPFGGEPGPGHSGYIPARLPRFQTKSDTRLADKDKAPSAISTPAASKADAFGAALGAANAKAETPPADAKRIKEDAELNQMRRIAGLDEARGEPEIGSKLPKSDVETFGLEPGRTYKTNPPKDWKQGDKPRALQQVIPTADKKDHIRSRLGKHAQPMLPEGAENLEECGDMGMSSQQDSMNVSTNMSSDGTKSVNISAQGDQADALLQMLKMAGMRPHDNDNSMGMTEPEIIMVSSGPQEEMMDEEYANTPNKEYHSVDSILRQGNDLNREKRQYADKPKLGDNPMAEAFALDLDLDAMLESILIREEDSAAKKVGDAVKNPGNAAKDVGDTVKGRLTTTKDTDGKTSVQSSTGRIRATFDKDKPVKYEPAAPEENEKTNEGVWDDVSNFVGDVVGTEASKLRQSSQLRDLDALRKQYKGTPYEKQVNDRYDTHLNRLQLDQGDVMDYDPKTGIERLKPVVPPDQWKGGK